MSKRRSHGEGSIFQDKNGLWTAEITVPGGQKHRKRSKSQKVARDWLLAQRDAIRDWTDPTDDKIRVGDFVDRYMADVAAHTLRRTTLEAYTSLVNHHIKPEIGTVRLVELRPAQLQELYSRKMKAGLSRRTVQFIHAIIHKALDQALRWGLVMRNVSDMVDAPTVKRKSVTTWSADDIRKFLAASEGHRFWPVFLLALATGMRRGELLGLHIEDIDWQAEVIHVKHSVQQVKGGLILSEPKTDAGRRAIKVPHRVIEVLRQHVQERTQGLVFQTRNGTPFTPRNVSREFGEAQLEAGVPTIRFHDMRHTYATLMLSANIHPKIVQQALGHSQISLTLDTYSHVLPHMQDEAARMMGNLLGSGDA